MASILPHALLHLIDELGNLPGVGPRTAERYAYDLLRRDPSVGNKLATAIAHLHANVAYCPKTFALIEKGQELSPLYTDPDRDKTVVAVVEEPLDVVAREMSWERGVSAYCVDTVPAALLAARSTHDPVVAIDTAIQLGGDTDTVAAIAGAIAGAHAPDRLPTTGIPAGWRAYLEELARAIAERRRPPRRLHPLVAVPRNVGVGLAMIGVILQARLIGW